MATKKVNTRFPLIISEASILHGMVLWALPCVVALAAATSHIPPPVSSQSFATSEGIDNGPADTHAKLLRRETGLHRSRRSQRLPEVHAARNASRKKLQRRHSLISDAGDASSLPWTRLEARLEGLERRMSRNEQLAISAQMPIPVATEPPLPMVPQGQVDPTTVHSDATSATEPPLAAPPATATVPAAVPAAVPVPPATAPAPVVPSTPQDSRSSDESSSGASSGKKNDLYTPDAGEHRISKTTLAVIIGFFVTWGLSLAWEHAKSAWGSGQNKLQRDEEDKKSQEERSSAPQDNSTTRRSSQRGGILAELDSGSQTPRRPSQHPRASEVPTSQLTSSRRSQRSVPPQSRASITGAIDAAGVPDGSQRGRQSVASDAQDADAAGGIPGRQSVVLSNEGAGAGASARGSGQRMSYAERRSLRGAPSDAGAVPADGGGVSERGAPAEQSRRSRKSRAAEDSNPASPGGGASSAKRTFRAIQASKSMKGATEQIANEQLEGAGPEGVGSRTFRDIQKSRTEGATPPTSERQQDGAGSSGANT